MLCGVFIHIFNGICTSDQRSNAINNCNNILKITMCINFIDNAKNMLNINFTIITSIADDKQQKTTLNQSKYTQVNQCNIINNSIQDNNTKPLNNELLDNITYTISALIHVPFTQQISCKKETEIYTHQKTVKIGSNELNVGYQGHKLPYGVYPRRLLSYLCKSLIKSRSKDPIVHIPRSRAQFYKEALGINYILSSKDAEFIKEQIEAFVACNLSLGFSNPNDKSRKERDSISFLANGHSWLYDDSQSWQSKIIISDEMFELIKATAVPISSAAVNTFTNARKLDILNYFLYQNYNLNLKKITATFQIEELYNLFGGGIATINEFRRVFNKILKELNQLVPLDIIILDKHRYQLIPSDDCLLKQHKRRKTNVIKDKQLVINEDFKQKLEKAYSAIDIEAASIYVSKRNKDGKVRHPYAYMRDVLKNPSWYQAERSVLIQSIHTMQKEEFKSLDNHKRKITAQELKARLSHTYKLGLPAELQDVYEQLRVPGREIIKKALNWENVCFLFWEFMTNRCVEYSSCSIESLYIQLFKHLK